MAFDENKLDSLRLDRDADYERTRSRYVPILVSVLFAVAAILAIVWFLVRAGSDRVSVSVATATRPVTSNQGTVLNASGFVVARRLATVSSKTTGRISEVYVEEGMQVEKNQVLARLDDSTKLVQFELTKSQLQAARRDLDEIRVRVAEAQRNLKRDEALRADNLVSESRVDASQSELSALRARLFASTADVEVAEKNVAVIQQDLDDLVIRAPFAGVVVSKDAQPGEMISPVSAGGGFTRTGICTIVDMDSREIEVDVNEAFINRVSPGQPAEAQLDAYPDWVIGSNVINIVPTADRQRATVKVRIAFDELDPRILPDMGIKVRFLEQESDRDESQPPILSQISAAAVNDATGKSYVWVVRNDTLERRAVRLGGQQGGAYSILSGLDPGERVVIDAPAGLTDGQEIKAN